MIDKIKQEAMRQGMKILSNPKVAKMMADPRFMQAMMKSFEMRAKLQSQVDCTLRSIAERLNLVTQDDLDAVRQDLNNVQSKVQSTPAPSDN